MDLAQNPRRRQPGAGWPQTLLALALWTSSALAQNPAPKNAPTIPEYDRYEPSPDTLQQPGVPEGKIYKFELDDSKIFPGTTRTISVYIPAEYQSGEPACVYVALDSLSWIPNVFDNLIHRKEIPVTIAIGVARGDVPSARPPENPRFDRSFEFDTLSGRLGKFLLEEVLPRTEQLKNADGKTIRLSRNPNDRAIGGSSTGAIAAFTVAWEYPDEFRRVYTSIGTFVGMRGGDHYPVLIRKTEPKPLRVFMQDGSHNQWPGGLEMGDWWMSNQTMERALIFAGYAVDHIWGTGVHSPRHSAAIFPDAMRWLWQNYPAPVVAGVSGNPALRPILEPNETWQEIPGTFPVAENLLSNSSGEVFFTDQSTLFKINDAATVEKWIAGNSAVTRFASGPDGTIYAADASGSGKILRYTADRKVSTFAEGIRARDLVVTNSGSIYIFDEESPGSIWLLKPDGSRREVDRGILASGGLAPSPDGAWLAVGETTTRWAYSYRIEADGSLQNREPFYVFEIPSAANDSGVRQMGWDRIGNIYAATRIGVQIFDRNGRVTAILPLPGNQPITALCFGGSDFQTLYVATNGKIYRRKMKSIGAPPWSPLIKLPPGNAG